MHKHSHKAVLAWCVDFPPSAPSPSPTSKSAAMCILRPFVLGDEGHNFPLEKKAAPFAVGQCTNVFVTAEAHALFGAERFKRLCEALTVAFASSPRTSSSMPPSAASAIPTMAILHLLDQVASIAPVTISYQATKSKLPILKRKFGTVVSASETGEDSVVSSGVGSVAAVAITAVLPSLKRSALTVASALMGSASAYLRCHAKRLLRVVQRLVDSSLPPPLPFVHPRINSCASGNRASTIFSKIEAFQFIAGDARRCVGHGKGDNCQHEETFLQIIDLESFLLTRYSSTSQVSDDRLSMVKAACATAIHCTNIFGGSVTAVLASGGGCSRSNGDNASWSYYDVGIFQRLLHLLAYALVLEIQPTEEFNDRMQSKVCRRRSTNADTATNRKSAHEFELQVPEGGKGGDSNMHARLKCAMSVTVATEAAGAAAGALDAMVGHAGCLLPPKSRFLLEAVVIRGLSQLIVANHCYRTHPTSYFTRSGVHVGVCGVKHTLSPALTACGEISDTFCASLLLLATKTVLLPPEGSNTVLATLLMEAATAVTFADGSKYMTIGSSCFSRNSSVWAARIAKATVAALLQNRCIPLVHLPHAGDATVAAVEVSKKHVHRRTPNTQNEPHSGWKQGKGKDSVDNEIYEDTRTNSSSPLIERNFDGGGASGVTKPWEGVGDENPRPDYPPQKAMTIAVSVHDIQERPDILKEDLKDEGGHLRVRNEEASYFQGDSGRSKITDIVDSDPELLDL